MEFYATARFSLTRTAITKGAEKEKEMIGQDITINCIKTKLTAPFRKCTLRLSFDEDTGMARFNFAYSLVEVLAKSGKIEKDGTRFLWDGLKLFKSEIADRVYKAGEYQRLVDLLKS